MPGKKYPLHWEQIFLSAQTRYNTIRTSFTKSRYFYTKQAINVKGFLFKAAFLTLLVTAPPLPSLSCFKTKVKTYQLRRYSYTRMQDLWLMHPRHVPLGLIRHYCYMETCLCKWKVNIQHILSTHSSTWMLST